MSYYSDGRGHLSDRPLEARRRAEQDEQNDSRFTERYKAKLAANRESIRRATIAEMGRVHGQRGLASEAILTGTPIERFEQELAERVALRRPLGEIGLSTKEIAQFSLFRWLNVRDRLDRNDLFEHECSRAVAQAIGEPDEGSIDRLFVPREVLQRDLNTADAASGGYFVSHQTRSFTAALQKRSVVRRLGATMLTGLRGSAAVPGISASATSNWLSDETDVATESTPTFFGLDLAPHTAGAYCEMSRKVVKQSSPAIEGVVMTDLGGVLAQAVDQAAIAGSGAAGQPTGLLSATGVGSFTGASIDYDAITSAELDVADANALVVDEALGWATTPSVARLLKTRVKFANTDSPIWVGGIHAGEIDGLPAVGSNSVPSATAIFGDWSQMVIAEWGTLEIESDPFSGFAAGIIGLRALWTIDVGLRHASSFSAGASIT